MPTSRRFQFSESESEPRPSISDKGFFTVTIDSGQADICPGLDDETRELFIKDLMEEIEMLRSGG